MYPSHSEHVCYEFAVFMTLYNVHLHTHRFLSVPSRRPRRKLRYSTMNVCVILISQCSNHVLHVTRVIRNHIPRANCLAHKTLLCMCMGNVQYTSYVLVHQHVDYMCHPRAWNMTRLPCAHAAWGNNNDLMF